MENKKTQEKIDNINANIHEKLSLVREEVAKKIVTKDGVGGTAKFSSTYYTKEQLYTLWASTNNKLFGNKGLLITSTVDDKTVTFNSDYSGVRGIMEFTICNIKNPKETLSFKKAFGHNSPSKNISFGIGSAETYATRYFYADIMELTADENDPESKELNTTTPKQPKQTVVSQQFTTPTVKPQAQPALQFSQVDTGDKPDFVSIVNDPETLKTIGANGQHLARFQQLVKDGIHNVTEEGQKEILSWLK